MTSTLQPGFECEYAFDGDVTSWKGWAYDGHVPASIVLNFETPVSMNAVAFKNAVGMAQYHSTWYIRDFSIDVLVGGAFLAVSGVKANDSPNINGNRIAFGDNYEDVMISFDTKLDVTAFRITVYSHTGNNGILIPTLSTPLCANSHSTQLCQLKIHVSMHSNKKNHTS